MKAVVRYFYSAFPGEISNEVTSDPRKIVRLFYTQNKEFDYYNKKYIRHEVTIIEE